MWWECGTAAEGNQTNPGRRLLVWQFGIKSEALKGYEHRDSRSSGFHGTPDDVIRSHAEQDSQDSIGAIKQQWPVEPFSGITMGVPCRAQWCSIA